MKMFHHLCVTLFIMVMLVDLCSSAEPEILNLEDYLQPDDVEDYYHYAPINDTKSCTRECVEGGAPKICYYNFFLEDYASLTGACGDCPRTLEDCYNQHCITTDGYERGVLSVNRRIPGPSIQVCLGDRIIVDVTNGMLARTSTIHWHGVFQKGTPYSDGVPMVTQCPINEGNAFRYDFYAGNPGTFYWHSHDGLQKLDGLQGSLVIRRPNDQEPNSELYDFDLPAHVIFVNDWFHTGASQHFPGLRTHDTTTFAYYYLVNGKGRYVNPDLGNTTQTPYAVFRVTQGNRYRFRIVGGLCTQCSASVTFQDHNITLIATDGISVEPITVNSLNIYSGERYDVVVDASKEVGSYWIQVRGLGDCQLTKPSQVAILQYEGSNELEPRAPRPNYEDYLPEGLTLNPINASCHQGEKGVCVTQLETKEDFPLEILKPEPDVNVTVTFGYQFVSFEEFQSKNFHIYIEPVPFNPLYTWVNNISLANPPSPVLSQLKDIPKESFCAKNEQGIPTCTKDICDCFQVIQVPLQSVVQFILIDQSIGGGLDHPFHLHGYAFNVMAMGYLNESLQNADDIAKLIKDGKLKHPAKPVLKDTIAVPSDGYAVIRIVTDNPGYWFFHCHFAHHLATGMATVIQVGETEDLPPVPEGFPTCGNYLPQKTQD